MTENSLIDKVYDPRAVEPDIARRWDESGAFASKPTDPLTPHDKTFTIVIPPPNVTGALHIGHALNNTLQDILVRYHRMRGFNTLWQPGTDHAGIATQAVVERRIREEEGKTRHEVGREKLVKKIWEWKEQYEARIIGQLKLMGCSCDWSRLRFTLDDGLARAVREIFFRLFKDGLIFRGKRLVNWDTNLQTAVSDDEVYHETVKGHFWHFKYPVIDPKPGEPEHVIIATTRPETMLGDTAVAVNPDPERFFDKQEVELKELWDRLSSRSDKDALAIKAKLETLAARRESHLADLIKLRDMANDGRMLMLPLVERKIPLICDEWADPTKGSGCVKITPAHDPNDYEVGLRQKLPMINVLTPDGFVARIDDAEGNPYEGLEFSKEGRKKVVSDMEARGLLHDVEDHEVELGHSDRSKTPIEPFLSDQWFVKTRNVEGTEGVTLGDGSTASGLAQAAMDAVSNGRIEVFPSRYAKSYLDWLGEKRDWCISRQLWWGHRIPVWTQECRDAALVELKLEEFRKNVERSPHLPIALGRTDDSLAMCIEDEQIDVRDYLSAGGWSQDPDVLDTWFSSALWPFSTLGWPDQTAHVKQYYPGRVLVTNRDIITNWVARMVMFGLYAMDDAPFDHVYIHPKILDGRGETMSKSKGNGVDPVDIIHNHGADALRFAMADMCTETQDIRVPVEYICPHCTKLTDQEAAIKAETQRQKSRGEKLTRKLQPSDCLRVTCVNMECGKEFATQWADDAAKQEFGFGRETSDKFDIGRNFCNKLWNASRFAFMNLEGAPCAPLDVAKLPPEDRWILARLSQTIRRYHEHMGSYLFSASVKELRDFFWVSLCDWYIELTKPRMTGDRGPDEKATAQQVLAFCIDQTLRLWHPTIPFITEHLWQNLGGIAPKRGLSGVADLKCDTDLVTAPFPPVEGYPCVEDDAILTTFAELQDATRGVRDVRASCGVSPKEKLTVTIVVPAEHLEAFRAHAHIVQHMANIGTLNVSTEAKRPANAGSLAVRNLRIYVHDISNDDAERGKLTKQLAALEKQIKGKEGKLANEKFVANAASEVVEAERKRLAELLEQRASLSANLAELGG